MNTNLLADIADVVVPFAARDAGAPDSYPAQNIEDLKRAGAVIAPFPAQLGGCDLSLVDAARLTECVAKASPSTALLLTMPLGLASAFTLDPGCVPERHRADWAAQSEAAAAEYRAGKWYAACNSEKGAGGSLAATKTVARRAEDGTWRLTGEKILASAGKYADYFFSSAKVTQDDLPGAGVVEIFFVRTDAPGVQIADDWNGFGMRSTESQTVRYDDTPAHAIWGWPNFLEESQAVSIWYVLFPAITLGCAASILERLATPAPESPALRLRFADAQMRIEALRAYLHETAAMRAAAGGNPRALASRVLRTKTYVTQESTKLCAELFALGGGRHYSRSSPVAAALADSFAGTALRPPLALALDQLVESFSL